MRDVRCLTRVGCLAGALLLVVGLAACGSGPGDQGQRDAGRRPQAQVAWSRLRDGGYLYLLVATGPQHGEVERVDLRTGTARRITATPGPFGVSMFSLSPAGLVLAEAPHSISQVDRLTSAGALRRVLPASAANALINQRGDLALWLRAGAHLELAVRARATGRLSPRARVGGRDSAVWRAGGLVVLRRAHGVTSWREVGPDGRPVTGRAGRLAGEHWTLDAATNVQGPVLLGSVGSRPGLLWWPGRRVQALAPGWRPGCVSPQGNAVLVTKGRRIGVIAIARPRVVLPIGHTSSAVVQCGWSERRYGAR